MKTWMKITACISLSVLCLFACIGYAAVSRNLAVTGSAGLEASEPEGIYISKVAVYSMTGISNHSTNIILPTNVKSSFTVTQQNASITYEITVHNKTDITYWYIGAEVASETDSANLIGTTNGISITTRDGAASSSTLFDQSDWVPPQTERTFYATYVFGSRAQGSIESLSGNSSEKTTLKPFLIPMYRRRLRTMYARGQLNDFDTSVIRTLVASYFAPAPIDETSGTALSMQYFIRCNLGASVSIASTRKSIL